MTNILLQGLAPTSLINTGGQVGSESWATLGIPAGEGKDQGDQTTDGGLMAWSGQVAFQFRFCWSLFRCHSMKRLVRNMHQWISMDYPYPLVLILSNTSIQYDIDI